MNNFVYILVFVFCPPLPGLTCDLVYQKTYNSNVDCTAAVLERVEKGEIPTGYYPLCMETPKKDVQKKVGP